MATATSRHIVVAINPTASFGARRDVGPHVVTALRARGHEVTALTEPDFERLEAAARAALGDRDASGAPAALVVVGGDGMVNLGTNLVAGTGIPLGIVPSGTGNDMARSLGIPLHDPDAAVELLAEALGREPRVIDAGRIRWTDPATGEPRERLFSCVLSAGFDAIVNERANRMRRPKGASRYTIAMLVELARLRPIGYRVEADGETIESAALLVCVGNANSIGGGMRVTPDAVLDDGLFDVMLVEPMSRLGFLRLFPTVFKGTHVADRRVRIVRASRVRIDAACIVGYADGERMGALPIEVEVLPGALRLLAPAGVTSPLPAS